MAAVQPPYFMQTGAHPAQVFRRALKSARVQGVVNPADLAVSAVAGVRAVSVAAGEGIVFGTENTLRQGAYHVLNDAAVQLAIAAADALNPRYDRIVAQVRDAEFSGANNDWLLAVVQGAPAVVPVEPALPANCLELARLLVAAGALSFVAGNLLDRRLVGGPQLGYAQIVAEQAGITALVDVAGCAVTVNVAGNRRIRLTGQGNFYSSVAGDVVLGRFREDATQLGVWMRSAAHSANLPTMAAGSVILTPAAGTHTYKLSVARETGTGIVALGASPNNPCFIVAEDIGPA